MRIPMSDLTSSVHRLGIIDEGPLDEVSMADSQ
jgi:hypothetical protein